MTFETLNVGLLSESYKRQHCQQQLEDEDVLTASFQRTSIHTPSARQGHGRGRWPYAIRGRGFLGQH